MLKSDRPTPKSAWAGAEERLSGVEERLARVEERLSHVEERLSDVEERLSRLELTVQKLTEQVAKLAEVQRTMVNDIGALKGRMLEQTYRDKAGAYFGPLLRRMRQVEPHTLEDTLEDRLTAGEFRDVLRLDLLVSGEPRRHSDAAEIWLAVEVSSVIDQHDVDRAERRAILLRKAGYRVVPRRCGCKRDTGRRSCLYRSKCFDVAGWEHQVLERSVFSLGQPIIQCDTEGKMHAQRIVQTKRR